jgi:hypothetical protein
MDIQYLNSNNFYSLIHVHMKTQSAVHTTLVNHMTFHVPSTKVTGYN